MLLAPAVGPAAPRTHDRARRRARMMAWRAVGCAVLAALVGCAAKDRAVTAPPAVVIIALALPGADAEQVERTAVEPVERALAGMASVRTIGARITADRATVTVELATASDLAAVADVQRVITELAPQLPAELEPPMITRAPASPVLWIEVGGPQAIAMRSEVATEVLQPALERLPGVAQLAPRGVVRRVIAIRPDRARLAATGLAVGELATAIRGQTRALPAGRMDATGPLVRVTGTIDDLETVRELVVGQVDGVPIRVADVASVEDTHDPGDGGDDGGGAGGAPALGLRVQPGAVPDEVTARVRAQLRELRRLLPPGMTLTETPPAIAPVAPLVITIHGPELTTLRQLADDLGRELRAAGATTIVRDPPEPTPERTLTIDRQRAAALGVSVSELIASIGVPGGDRLGELVIAGRRRDLVLRHDTERLEDLAQVQVRSPRAGLVPLGSLVTITASLAPTIIRRDRQRVVTLAVDAARGALAAARARLAELTPGLPAGYAATATVTGR